MRRRELLGLVGAGAVGLAGCTGDAPPVDGDTASPTPTGTSTEAESPTPTPMDTPAPTPEPEPIAVSDSEFQVRSVECGTGKASAAVAHESTGERTGRVTVDGVVVGSDSCHRARLGDVAASDGTLRVAVEAYVPEENEEKACAECVVDATYRATVEYEGDGPFDVVVEHDGEQVIRSGPYPGGDGTVEY
jgi:hypothetical protein